MLLSLPPAMGAAEGRIAERLRTNKEGMEMTRRDRPRGRGQVSGGGRGRAGGRGRGGGFAAGPGGYCVCPNCGEKEVHQLGIPCFEQKCPNCGKAMIREQ